MSSRRTPSIVSRDEVARESPAVPVRELRPDQNALVGVEPLLDRGTEPVEGRQRRAVVVGHEQSHVLVAVGEQRRDVLAELVEAFAGGGRDAQRLGEAVRDAAPRERVEPVDLVQNERDRKVVAADLRENRVDRRDLLPHSVFRERRVDDVQDQIGDERLLQRRREPLNELRRKASDEADGVGDEVALAVELEPPRRRIERLEEAVLDRDVRAGEGVEERRLADVRVPRERDRRHLGPLALLATDAALGPERLEPRSGGR